MNTKVLLSTIAMAMSCFLLKAQEKTVNLSMGEQYAKQVYYKLDTEKVTSFDKNSWDIAFLRDNRLNHGIRVNDGIGIKVYEVSNNPKKWNEVDVEKQTKWKELYNSETNRNEGAFMKGSAKFGWGIYNFPTHRVLGKIIFVLKYANGSYKKFFCKEYRGGYTFKYASWNDKEKKWSEDITAKVLNKNNPKNNYNYYSLQKNKEVVAEPAKTDWDFVFTKYYADYTMRNGKVVKYNVTGVLSSNNIKVAKATGDDTSSLKYLTDINAIGYNWKFLKGGKYQIHSNRKYYVKYKNGTIYKMYFTAFAGGKSGNISFKVENVTASLGIEEIGENMAFGVYPNPSIDKKIQIVYDIKKANTSKNSVEIYSVTGQKVFTSTATNNEGFYNKEINLGDLSAGVYILKFTSGNYQKTRKIVLQ